jgi:hypothetical protein
MVLHPPSRKWAVAAVGTMSLLLGTSGSHPFQSNHRVQARRVAMESIENNVSPIADGPLRGRTRDGSDIVLMSDSEGDGPSSPMFEGGEDDLQMWFRLELLLQKVKEKLVQKYAEHEKFQEVGLAFVERCEKYRQGTDNRPPALEDVEVTVNEILRQLQEEGKQAFGKEFDVGRLLDE